MNLLQLISKNNLFKFSLFFITIFLISFNAQSEIPKKYKIESSLKKCKGTNLKDGTIVMVSTSSHVQNIMVNGKMVQCTEKEYC